MMAEKKGGGMDSVYMEKRVFHPTKEFVAKGPFEEHG